MTNVFVYGSLKEGYHNHDVLRDSLKVCDAISVEKYTMINLGAFPGLMLEVPTSHIHGEIYHISDEVFKDLDLLEGFPYFYDRKIVEFKDANDNTHEAWVYYLADPKKYINRINKDYLFIHNGVWTIPSPHFQKESYDTFTLSCDTLEQGHNYGIKNRDVTDYQLKE
jgi:gamma-glutamylcyclotransferase (GGCT)/AIG2-like uncharacterized protein YtfP